MKKFFDRTYLVWMAAASAVIIPLNFYARGMQGLLPSYLDIKRVILSGFDPSVAVHGSPTFPMWGYAWLLMLTENQLALLILQNALGLFMIWLFVRWLEKSRTLDADGLFELKVLLFLSVPFYACHSLRWPYSIASSLLIGMFVLLTRAFDDEAPHVRWLVGAGIMIGLSLNFRSDHVLLSPFLGLIILLMRGFRLTVVKKVALWILTAAWCMVPWMIYTYHIAGKMMLTSTNAGWVAFIGLGQLPNNPSGITPFDEDPLMNGLIKRKFGDTERYMSPRINEFLQEEFRKRVLAEPAAYAKKCLLAFGETMVDGSYRGEFYELPACQPHCELYYKEQKKVFLNAPIAFIAKNPHYFAVLMLQIYSGIFGRILVLVSFLFLPLVLARGVAKKDLILVLIAAIILYQAAIDAIIFHKSSSTAMVYVFHLVNACLGWMTVRSWARERGAMRAG